ncbi:MAG TPA: hypothetical protein VGS03_00815 [Candidatus Polarisedimenticolia bacterium]|nr:hypothetical protein [Candidatus Polarisedimenticolia bacterium]
MSSSAVRATVVSVCLVFCTGGAAGLAQDDPGDVLVGVTSSDGCLVSLDPATGAILHTYVPIDPTESFSSLAFDRNHGKLHVLSQGDHVLYTLNAATLKLANVVPLRLISSGAGDLGDSGTPTVTEITSLAYDPITDTLYGVVGRWTNYPAGPISDDLIKVDPWTGQWTVLGRIDGPWITSLAFSETDRMLYGLGVIDAGPWDDPDATRVIRIDPATVATETVAVTPYHVVLGLALKDPGTFFSWVNGASHFFAQTDVATSSLKPLGDGAVGGLSAMLVKTFDLPPEPVWLDSQPVGFLYKGHVTDVADPLGRLAGLVQAGQFFRGQITYDTTVPFQSVVPGRGGAYGITLQSGRYALSAPEYAAAIANDRLDPADPGPTDEFRLRGTTSSGVVLSWTLLDASGNAVAATDRLPAGFDLAKWPGNIFTVTAWDPCCLEPIYSFTGRVDEIKPRPGLAVRPLPRSKRRDRS